MDEAGEGELPPSPAPHPQKPNPNFQSGSFYLAKNRNFLFGLDMAKLPHGQATPTHRAGKRSECRAIYEAALLLVIFTEGERDGDLTFLVRKSNASLITS
jgi:hypothetical protein